jgi:hypothetical protein
MLSDRSRARGRATTRIARAIAFAILAAIAGASCRNEPTVDELIAEQIVVTKFDPAADFSSYATFAIPETITLVRSFDAQVAPLEQLDPAVAGPILDELSTQLTSRGYTRVARTAGPDVGVAVTAIVLLRVETVSNGAWWSLGNAAPDFWGYDGATITEPFAYETVAWRSGTLIVELEDLRAARDRVTPSTPNIAAAATDVPAEIRIVWAAITHGVVGPDPSAAPVAALQQAFAQSPYLRR